LGESGGAYDVERENFGGRAVGEMEEVELVVLELVLSIGSASYRIASLWYRLGCGTQVAWVGVWLELLRRVFVIYPGIYL
jgi:hypothetical protein